MQINSKVLSAEINKLKKDTKYFEEDSYKYFKLSVLNKHTNKIIRIVKLFDDLLSIKIRPNLDIDLNLARFYEDDPLNYIEHRDNLRILLSKIKEIDHPFVDFSLSYRHEGDFFVKKYTKSNFKENQDLKIFDMTHDDSVKEFELHVYYWGLQRLTIAGWRMYLAEFHNKEGHTFSTFSKILEAVRKTEINP